MQVKWFRRAVGMLDDALAYSFQEFDERTARRFYDNIRRYESLLSDNPQLGKVEPLLTHRKKEYRSIVVHESYKLIYYVGKTSIYVIALWNCKQNPRKLAKL